MVEWVVGWVWVWVWVWVKREWSEEPSRRLVTSVCVWQCCRHQLTQYEVLCTCYGCVCVCVCVCNANYFSRIEHINCVIGTVSTSTSTSKVADGTGRDLGINTDLGPRVQCVCVGEWVRWEERLIDCLAVRPVGLCRGGDGRGGSRFLGQKLKMVLPVLVCRFVGDCL